MHPATHQLILSEAYRRAALAGRDMYAFASSMEQVQAVLSAESEPYKQWERLDDLIGEALWMGADAEPFRLARTVFLEYLGDQGAAAILQPGAAEADDWGRWRTAFSEASFQWRFEAMHALCEMPALQSRFGKKLMPFQQFLPLFRDRRWVETHNVFWALAEDKNLPEEHRGYHYYVCGQIDLYFHYDYAQAKRLFDTAESMLAGKPLAQHGHIEYFLKGPERERDLDRALELAEAALRLAPDHVASILQKGDVLVEKGRWDEAEALFRAASRKRPGNTLCYTRLIDLYGKPEFFEKKQAEIEALLGTVEALDPDARFRTRSDVAVIFQNQGETFWPKAENLHQEAIRQYPEGIMARLNLGYLYLDVTKELDKAEPIFLEVTTLMPEAREGYLAVARLREAQERWAEAVENYRRVQQIIPSWERFMAATIGRCLRQQNHLADAETPLLRAWELDAYDDSGTLTELYELAERLYKNPDDPRPEAAVALLQRAAEVRSGTPANAAGIANRQGHAYFYKERYAEALPYYQQAAALVPTEAVYFTNQFDCLEKIYRQSLDEAHYEAALEALHRAAQIAPQDSAIPKKRRQLARVRYNPHLAELPVLYHLHVEVGQPLLGEITQDFNTLLPGMTVLTDDLRRRMNDRFAINLPGLRYRDISDGNGAYQFRLYETPVQYGHLPTDQPPTMAAVLERLEAFLTHYGLDLFVNYWDVDREVPFLPNAELVHFTRVVMALLAEQASLPPLPELHQLYRSLDVARLSVSEAVESLRLSDALRPNLPGVQDDFSYILLGEQEERLLVACLVGQGSARALALPLDHIPRFFGAVYRRVQEHAGQQVALVVGNADLRPFLRSMLAGLPELPVLKTSEVPVPRFIDPLVLSEHDDEGFQQFFQPTANASTDLHLPLS